MKLLKNYSNNRLKITYITFLYRVVWAIFVWFHTLTYTQAQMHYHSVDAPSYVSDKTLRIASYNLNWLGAKPNKQRRKLPKSIRTERTAVDFNKLSRLMHILNADIIAVQEVKQANILEKILNPNKYTFLLTNQPHKQRTGFAIRKHIHFKRNDDLTTLQLLSPKHNNLRSAADITIFLPHNETLRILSVHLKSGCYSLRRVHASCNVLKKQFQALATWLKEVHKKHDYVIIAGDFNRRLIKGDPLLSILEKHQVDNFFWRIFKKHRPNDTQFTAPFMAKRPQCWGGRFFGFIDHFVMLSQSKTRMTIQNTGEITYPSTLSFKNNAHLLSDHCPIYIDLGNRFLSNNK